MRKQNPEVRSQESEFGIVILSSDRSRESFSDLSKDLLR